MNGEASDQCCEKPSVAFKHGGFVKQAKNEPVGIFCTNILRYSCVLLLHSLLYFFLADNLNPKFN